MKQGYLSQYFIGIAAKELSAVEVNSTVSNQHEFNGVNSLRQLLGDARNKFMAKFMYLTDHDDPVFDSGFLTWYNAREGRPRSAEYRLYFPETLVSMKAKPGDFLVIGMQLDGTILAIIAEQGSTVSSQISWLFGFEHIMSRFNVRSQLETEQDKIVFTSTLILEQIGIEVELVEESYLDAMLVKFGEEFPPTKIFSQYARSTLPHISSLDDPDGALIAWIEREEILFRTLEHFFLAKRINQGFENDVDGFLSYALSVLNRRKSRVGYALENHLEQIWQETGVHYSRGQVTENRSQPDFLFPSGEKYHDLDFQPGLLSMLGVKSTCKDRWRQVLLEADRIPKKHLLTLEAAISETQTTEMQSRQLQLVVPKAIQKTYSDQQRSWLWDLQGFIEYVKQKQLQLG